MPKTKHVSLKLPEPVAQAIEEQRRRGLINYPSRSAAILALLRYQALYGGPHWITEEMARMDPVDQDVIDDFLLALNERGLTMGGSFLRHLADRAAAGQPEPDAQEIPRRTAREILELARRHVAGDESVWEDLRADS